MSLKLYVGNLPYEVSEDQLEDLFAECGEVRSVKILIDRESGRSKGVGFVEMASEEEVLASIEKFNGQNIFGRTLKVDQARDRVPGAAGAPGAGGGNSFRPSGPRRDGGGGGNSFRPAGRDGAPPRRNNNPNKRW